MTSNDNLTDYAKYIARLARSGSDEIFSSLEPQIGPAIIKHLLQQVISGKCHSVRVFTHSLEDLIPDEELSIHLFFNCVRKNKRCKLVFVLPQSASRSSKLYRTLVALRDSDAYGDRVSLSHLRAERGNGSSQLDQPWVSDLKSTVIASPMFREEYKSGASSFTFNNKAQARALADQFDTQFLQSGSLEEYRPMLEVTGEFFGRPTSPRRRETS